MEAVRSIPHEEEQELKVTENEVIPNENDAMTEETETKTKELEEPAIADEVQSENVSTEAEEADLYIPREEEVEIVTDLEVPVNDEDIMPEVPAKEVNEKEKTLEEEKTSEEENIEDCQVKTEEETVPETPEIVTESNQEKPDEIANDVVAMERIDENENVNDENETKNFTEDVDKVPEERVEGEAEITDGDNIETKDTQAEEPEEECSNAAAEDSDTKDPDIETGLEAEKSPEVESPPGCQLSSVCEATQLEYRDSVEEREEEEEEEEEEAAEE